LYHAPLHTLAYAAMKADRLDLFEWYDPASDRLQCLVCGKWFKSLATHLLMAHGITASAYREQHGILWTTPLTNKEILEKASEQGKRLLSEGRISLDRSGDSAARGLARARTLLSGPGIRLKYREFESGRRAVGKSNAVRGISDETRRKASERRKGKRLPTDSVGESNGRAKLAVADVLQIRSSTDTHAALARRFGVTATTIFNIRKRKLWSHLADPDSNSQTHDNKGAGTEGEVL